MKQLVVVSGKGGTGKTTVTAALAHLAAHEYSLVLADADVDAANLELVLAAQQRESHSFDSGETARVLAEICIACGRCTEVCRFDALHDRANGDPPGVPQVDPLACEGCAACYYVCPAGAITMEPQHNGLWFRSETLYGPLLHARLAAGGENSGRLVMLVKHEARADGLGAHADLLLVDGPPGIGCPVIAALTGADLALLVTEPTAAGLHDLQRIVQTTRQLRVPAVVAINKYDLHSAYAEEIARYCAGEGLVVVGRIPYDARAVEAVVCAQPVTLYDPGSAMAQTLNAIWCDLASRLVEKRK